MTASPLRIVGRDEAPAFPLVPGTPAYAAALEKSEREGRHICDEYRTEIMRRFDPMCHVRGDRAPALNLPANWKAPR